ncbi:MAG: 3-deoxy-D-manno-octulosonic acid kinase [Xanthomonadales bacterium]|nr:3-deoxy-D-manno-octulosonic acid kinase [Xanthomonadales bacterium]
MTTSEDIGVVHAAAGGIVFDRRQVPQPDPAWFEPARWASGEVSGRGGRGAVWRVDTPAGRAVLRHYRRGGLVARLVRDHYLWLGASRTRCRREFDLLLRLRALELPVPVPLAARWVRRGLAYGADLLTLEIPDARTLAESLPQLDAVRDADGLASLGRVLARFHRAGVAHADLNAHNIMLDRHGSWWLIDFDRGRIRVPSTAWIERTLERLRRSLAKVGGEARADALFPIIREAHDSSVSTAHDY